MKHTVPLPAALLQRLADAAWDVRRHAYCPASRFRVGAAVLADDGRIFVGCNVENASYGLTICAERAAVAAAVAGGVRRLGAVAIATSKLPPARPCGACRQVLAEFGQDMAVVLLGGSRRQRREHVTLAELLPQPFTFAGAGRSRPRRR